MMGWPFHKRNYTVLRVTSVMADGYESGTFVLTTLRFISEINPDPRTSQIILARPLVILVYIMLNGSEPIKKQI